MKTYIFPFIFFILSFFNLYSQEKTYKNFFELEELMKDTAYKSEEESEGRLDREHWFISTRYDNNGEIRGYIEAVHKFYSSLRSRSTNKKALMLNEQEETTWSYIGPKGLNSDIKLYSTTNYGSIGRGWINSIKVLSPDTIYAGARNSGLWLTKNGGDSWDNISESEPLINGIFSILIDPDDSEHLIVLTGRNTAGELTGYSNGLFETYNNGLSWFYLPVFVNGEDIFPSYADNMAPVKLVNNPSNFNDLFLVTSGIVYRKSSQNNWEIIHQNNWNTDLVFDKLNNNIFYIGGTSIFKNTITAEGIIAENITNLVTPFTSIQRSLIGISDNYPEKVWFYYKAPTNGILRLSKLEDNSYIQFSKTFGSSGNLTMKIAPSETNEHLVYLGSISPMIFDETQPQYATLISDSYLGPNESASNVTDYLHEDTRDIQVLKVNGSERVYLGHDGGVAWGENRHDSCGLSKFCWHQISDDGSDGLQTNEFYGISISNSNNLIIQGGTQDCSTFIFDESVNKWYHGYKGDGLEGAISLDNSNRFITGGGGGGVNSYILYDKSNLSFHYSFGDKYGSLNSRAKLDPLNSNILYIGGNYLYRITNSFSSSFSQDVVTTPVKNRISAFTIGQNNNSILYVAETITDVGNNSNHMWRYNPSTSSWIDLSANLSQYNNSFVTDMVTNPEDDLEVWICMGQTTNSNKKVFHSANGGLNWDEMCLGYPEGIPANRLLFDHVSGLLYVATDVGIFCWDIYKPDYGWNYLTETMKLKMISDIERDYINNRLIVSTFGRGIWEGQLHEDDCYDSENSLNITTSINWNTPQTICQDIYVVNSGHLIISNEILLSKGATIYVEDGGVLTISAGHLKNGNVQIYSGGYFDIQNNGIIDLSGGDNINSETGAIIAISNGTIRFN